MKKIVLGISGVLSFLVFLVLLIVSNSLGSSQLSQTMAERWSGDGKASQVSCFFSVGSRITEDELIEFEHTVDGALADASVVQESVNPGARLWADAYSADGQVTLSNDKTSLTADAIGIGGDFFLFHPLTLLNGAYFSGNDLMQDYCVIDEDAAWQLFGSNDVAGMTVFIGGIPHIVTGVVRRPSGHLAEAAGLDSTLVYVSYQTLTELGSSHGINHYEIVMPNPVTGFAYNYVSENLGSNEKEVEVVENTSRYSILSRLRLLGQLGTRSMNGKAIIYPYWENIARGYEDILALMTLAGLLFLLYPVGLGLVFFCIWWRHKGWTLRDVRYRIRDFAERRVERLREKRKQGKRKKADQESDGFGMEMPDEEEIGEDDGWTPDDEEIREDDGWTPDDEEIREDDGRTPDDEGIRGDDGWTSDDEGNGEDGGWTPNDEGNGEDDGWMSYDGMEGVDAGIPVEEDDGAGRWTPEEDDSGEAVTEAPEAGLDTGAENGKGAEDDGSGENRLWADYEDEETEGEAAPKRPKKKLFQKKRRKNKDA